MECISSKPLSLLSETDLTLSMECVSLYINLLSLSYASLLNSFLPEARTYSLAAICVLSPDAPYLPNILTIMGPKCLFLASLLYRWSTP